MSGKLVLVTGVGGFIATHVAEQLLARGYRVRGTARGPKYQLLADTVKKSGLEFAQIDDVATSDFSKALKDVYAVIHLACALPGKQGVNETFKSAVEGTLNVLRQAQSAGVNKIIVTSSFGCLLSPTLMPAFHGLTLTEKDWGTYCEEELEEQKDNKYYVYFAAKIKAEQALWDFVTKHSELQVATILPGYVIGPYTNTFPHPDNKANMGTNDFLQGILSKGEIPFAPNWIVDVRDVARGHILALEGLPYADAENSRFIINSGTYTWAAAAAHIKEVRPQVADRIVPLETITPLPGVLSHLDNTKSRSILGIGKYHTPDSSVEAAVDAVLQLQEKWSGTT